MITRSIRTLDGGQDVIASRTTNQTERLYFMASAKVDKKTVRKAKLFGRDQLVVPVVALVEGVLHPSNAPEPELALAAEFGRFPEGWNGRPVVFDHPKINGKPISANNPKTLQDGAFGMLFNTTLDGLKLKTEAWIDLGRAKEIGGDTQAAVEILQKGEEVVEVSTGLFMTLEDKKGTYGKQAFSGIWRDVVPDHLAILPQGITGACSVASGCGAPRINSEGELMDELVITDNAEGDCSCDPPKPGTFSALVAKAGKLFTFRIGKNTMSDVDTRAALQAAMKAKKQSGYILAVTSDAFVYEDYNTGGTFSQGYSISGGGKITLKEDAVQVRPVTEFVPVTTNEADPEEGMTMVKKEKVDALISNSKGRYTEADRKWLEPLDETIVDRMTVQSAADIKTAEEHETLRAAAQAVIDEKKAEEKKVADKAAEIAANAGKKAATVDEFIKDAPAEIAQVLSEGIRMQRDRKTQLVGALKTNARNKFAEAELNAMDLKTLENLAELAQVPNFAGQGGNTPIHTLRARNTETDNAAPMPEVFPRKTA